MYAVRKDSVIIIKKRLRDAMQNGSKPDGRCRHEVVGIEWNEARNQAKDWKRSVQPLYW